MDSSGKVREKYRRFFAWAAALATILVLGMVGVDVVSPPECATHAAFYLKQAGIEAETFLQKKRRASESERLSSRLAKYRAEQGC